MKPINQMFSDDAKLKMKLWLRRGRDQLRSAGPPIGRWILTHKALVVIIVLLLYILWPHHSPPEVRGPDPTVATSNSAPATPPTTQPTTQPGVTPQYAGDIPLFAPGAEGADPKWSLPAELSGADIQAFIKKVNDLANQFNTANDLEQRYIKTVDILVDDKTFILFWGRALGPGFRDKNLPLDWYQVVKDRPTGLVAMAKRMFDQTVRQAVTDAVMTRFRSIQTRLIGGKLLIGDQLFIKTFQVYEDDRFSRFKKLTPLAEGVATRAAKEFEKELAEQQKNSGG